MSPQVDFSRLTLQDALDLSILIEQEAEERYREFNEMLGKRYEDDASDLFTVMAENEAKHGRELSEIRDLLFKGAPIRMTREMFADVEAPDYGKPRQYMSPRQAMNVALESEIKAYDFFDQALKFVRDPQVKILFEELRDEELEHKQMIERFLAKLSAEEGSDKAEDELDEPPGLD